MDCRKNSCITRYTKSKHKPELITRKTTVEIHKNLKFSLAKNETSPRLECKYAVKSDLDVARIKNLQFFPLYLDCQNNNYELDFLRNSTSKPISYSSWIKNNTQQKPVKQKMCRTEVFPLVEKEN